MPLATNITVGQADHNILHDEERTAINRTGYEYPRRVGTGYPGLAAPTSTDPVGSEYIDINRTNGASRWLKAASGTGSDKWIAVNVRANRDLTALLDNGWAVLNGAHKVRLQIAGDVCILLVPPLDAAAASSTTAISATLPTGLRPVVDVISWSRATGDGPQRCIVTASGQLLRPQVSDSAQAAHTVFTWMRTVGTLPADLPGVAL